MKTDGSVTPTPNCTLQNPCVYKSSIVTRYDDNNLRLVSTGLLRIHITSPKTSSYSLPVEVRVTEGHDPKKRMGR